MSMDVNAAGGGATTEQMTKAAQDIAQWAKTADLKSGEPTLYRQLAADGIASPEQNGPMGNYIHALENLKAKNTDFTSDDGWSKAFTGAIDAGKEAGIDTHNLYEAAENASHNPDEAQAASQGQSNGAPAAQKPAPATTTTPATNAAPQDTSEGKKAVHGFLGDSSLNPFSAIHNLKPDECKQFGQKYYDDYKKVVDDNAAGRNNPDNVNALNEDNKKWKHLNDRSMTDVISTMQKAGLVII